MAGFAADNAEDTLGNHIEQILAVLRPKTEFLRSQAKAGAAPTTEQITTFFQRCGAEIGPHVRRLDTKIKRRMQNCFHQCGYDVAHARLIRAVPVPTMLASFETMVSGLGSLLRGPVPPPSEEEIKDIRFAAQRMWNLDYNRVGHGHGLTIDLPRPPRRRAGSALQLRGPFGPAPADGRRVHQPPGQLRPPHGP